MIRNIILIKIVSIITTLGLYAQSHKQEFRVSLSVIFADGMFDQGFSYEDGKRRAENVEELQKMFKAHGSTEVYARISTRLESHNEGLERAKLTKKLGLTFNPEIGLFGTYSDVTLMDSILGNVYNALEERNKLNNSLFIYTSDQGANWPFGKWTLYDAGLRVPFIARWPGKIDPGSETNAMISLADVLPTCTDSAGGDPAESLDRQSILGVLIGKTEQHRDVVFGTHTGNHNGGPGVWNHCPTRMIRTRQYKYILNLEPDSTFTTHITGSPRSSVHYLPFWNTWEKEAETNEYAYQIVNHYLYRPMEELYDLDADPYEMNNLANDPDYWDILGSLKKQLAQWRESQGDTIPANGYYNHQIN